MANIYGTNANQLIALAALLESRSVTEAARRVGVTQPAMSGTLAQLRELLDDPLLVRVGRSMEPTPRALELMGPLRRALAALEEVLETPAPFQPASSEHRFAIAVDDRADLIVVPELMRRIGDEAPRVALQVHAWGRHDPPPALASGDLDVAIGVFRPWGTRSIRRGRGPGPAPAPLAGGLAGHLNAPLFSVGLSTLVRSGHPRVGRSLDLDQFCALDHVLVTEESWDTGVIDAMLARKKRTRRIALRVPRFLGVGWIVARTDLVATIDDRIARMQAEALGLRVLATPVAVPDVSFSMVWHERTDSDPARAWLRQQIADTAANCGAATAPGKRSHNRGRRRCS
jgi:DNA-binding transcriptional LysR family regulator